MIMGDIQALDIQIPREIGQYLGVVSGVWDRTAAARRRRRCPVCCGHGRYDAFFGWLLIITSAIEVIQAVMVGHWIGFFHHLLATILFGVIGVMLIDSPFSAPRP
jgi:hypothetical protein